MMLERAGFVGLTTYADFTERPATQESKTVIYGARRPQAQAGVRSTVPDAAEPAGLRETHDRANPSPTSTRTESMEQSFALVDLHVHLSPQLPLARALELAALRGVGLGIVEHPGPGQAIQTDADLARYLDMLEPHAVYKGLQPVFPGWARAFSPELLGRLDYVLMDALTLPRPDGTWQEIWRPQTDAGEAQAFMDRTLQFIARLLAEEPIDVFGWPTFLPDALAGQYDVLWTDERLERLVSLAAARRIALEINDYARVPGARCIRRAKEAGLRFTCGTDSRDDRVGLLPHARAMIAACGLRAQDFYVPSGHWPRR
jgi:hypothetical protein